MAFRFSGIFGAVFAAVAGCNIYPAEDFSKINDRITSEWKNLNKDLLSLRERFEYLEKIYAAYVADNHPLSDFYDSLLEEHLTELRSVCTEAHDMLEGLPKETRWENTRALVNALNEYNFNLGAYFTEGEGGIAVIRFSDPSDLELVEGEVSTALALNALMISSQKDALAITDHTLCLEQ